MGSRVPTGPGWWWRKVGRDTACVEVFLSSPPPNCDGGLWFVGPGDRHDPVADDGRWLGPAEPPPTPHPMTVSDALHALAEHPGPIAEAAREELRGQPLDAVVDLAAIRAAVRALEAALVAVRANNSGERR
jgi:hypothetical protein